MLIFKVFFKTRIRNVQISKNNPQILGQAGYQDVSTDLSRWLASAKAQKFKSSTYFG